MLAEGQADQSEEEGCMSPRHRQVGIKDVARQAGVSVGTVSNVLNRPDLVSEIKREKVERAITQLGYVRNGAARQLKVGRSRTAAALVLDMGNPFYSQLVHGMETEADQRGLAVITGSSRGLPDREKTYLAMFEEQRARGILLASAGQTDEAVRGVRERGTPVVRVEDDTDETGAWVAVDHRHGGRIAVEHLVALGRRRIAVVMAHPDLRQVQERLDGAAEAVAGSSAQIEILDAGDLDVIAGRAMGEQIARRGRAERPDAVFCVNDLLAVGVMQALVFGGDIAVPEDIALIGYDDIAFSRATVVPLSTIAQPSEQMGRAAVELLEEEITAGGSVEPRGIRFAPRLVVRGSSSR